MVVDVITSTNTTTISTTTNSTDHNDNNNSTSSIIPGLAGWSSVVVLAQSWLSPGSVPASCMKYLIHDWALAELWLGPPGAANTLQRPPLRHLLRKYGSHCSLNQTFNFGISNRHQSAVAQRQ